MAAGTSGDHSAGSTKKLPIPMNATTTVT